MPILSKYKSPEEEIIALRGALDIYDNVTSKVSTFFENVAVPHKLKMELEEARILSKVVR